MSLFTKYDNLLKLDVSINYWSDQILEEAIIILSNFDTNDWSMLSGQWQNQTSLWQQKCAQTLSEVQSDQNLFILLSMLDSEDKEVLEMVADSLNNMSQMGAKLSLNDTQIKKIKNLAKQGGIIQKIISNFIDKIDIENGITNN